MVSQKMNFGNHVELEIILWDYDEAFDDVAGCSHLVNRSVVQSSNRLNRRNETNSRVSRDGWMMLIIFRIGIGAQGVIEVLVSSISMSIISLKRQQAVDNPTLL